MFHTASKEDIAWTAGLFEGEGCITLGKNCPRIQVNITDEDVLRRFYNIVGVGTFSGPYHKPEARFKPHWLWRCSGTELPQAIICFFWKWLGIRRKERAREVLAICHVAPLAAQVINRAKKVCLNGHEFKLLKRGTRYCPTCTSLRKKARRKYTRGKYNSKHEVINNDLIRVGQGTESDNESTPGD